MQRLASRPTKLATLTIAAMMILIVSVLSAASISRAQQPQYTPQQVEETRKKAIEMGLLFPPHEAPKKEPPVITPGAKPGDPPSDATILFDGKDLSAWKS